jgi:hypothetical protein
MNKKKKKKGEYTGTMMAVLYLAALTIVALILNLKEFLP